MITIVNEDEVFVFDEIGWGETRFHLHHLLENIVTNYFDNIRRVEFYSKHNVICVKTISPNEFDYFRINSSGEADYWFQNIDTDLLNFLCKTPKFRRAVKRFFIKSGFPSFNIEKYPLLAAVLLGDNSEC